MNGKVIYSVTYVSLAAPGGLVSGQVGAIQDPQLVRASHFDALDCPYLWVAGAALCFFGLHGGARASRQRVVESLVRTHTWIRVSRSACCSPGGRHGGGLPSAVQARFHPVTGQCPGFLSSEALSRMSGISVPRKVTLGDG